MRGGLNRFVSIAFLSCLIACSPQRRPEPDRPTRAAVAPPASSPLAKVEVGMTPREVENLLGPPTDENQLHHRQGVHPLLLRAGPLAPSVLLSRARTGCLRGRRRVQHERPRREGRIRPERAGSRPVSPATGVPALVLARGLNRDCMPGVLDPMPPLALGAALGRCAPRRE